MNRSLFGPNYSRKIAMVTDGLSNTLMASEGLSATPRCEAAWHTPTSPRIRSPDLEPDQRPGPRPDSVAALAYQIINSLRHGRERSRPGGPIGHTRWCNGGVYYSGFTTAMPPNRLHC